MHELAPLNIDHLRNCVESGNTISSCAVKQLLVIFDQQAERIRELEAREEAVDAVEFAAKDQDRRFANAKMELKALRQKGTELEKSYRDTASSKELLELDLKTVQAERDSRVTQWDHNGTVNGLKAENTRLRESLGEYFDLKQSIDGRCLQEDCECLEHRAMALLSEK